MRGVACVLAAAVAVAATGCTRDEKQSAVPADAVASTSSSAASSPTTSSSAPIPTASPKPHSTPSRNRQSPGKRRTASTSPRQGATPARPKKLTSRHAVAAALQPGHPVRSHANQAHAVQPRATRSHAATSSAVSVYAPGTRVSWRSSRQVMVADRTSGTHGTWVRYQWRGSSRGWVRVSAAGVGSVFGSGGVVDAGRRRQGTNTTPAGTFGVVSAFGVGNPGTKLSYRTIGRCSWWIEDPAAKDYNRWREDCSHLSTSNNERLADYAGSLYRQAVVLSYNYASPVRRGAGSGAGIFLHYATRHTGGSVGVNSCLLYTSPSQRD